MKIFEKIKGYGTYRYYLEYLNNLKSKGIDVRFSSKEFYLLPQLFNEYIEFVRLPEKITEESLPENELDDIIFTNFADLFDDNRKKIFLAGVKCKNIIPDYSTCTTCVDEDGFYMIMNQYKYLSDIANFMHEIVHVFIFTTRNPHINSEVMSILFELIARDKIEQLSKSDKYLIPHINTLLNSMLANIRLLELFPKITPVILPYIKAEYLSYELFLLYKRDPERFIYHFRRILNSELSIEQYLRDNKITMREENFEKIKINHKKILTKQ